MVVLDSPRTRRGKWSCALSLAVVGIGFVVLAVRLFRLISRYAVNIFFSDQWEFNTPTVFQHRSLWEMFRWQNGPHRQGLGALLSYAIEPHFRWNSRTESFLIGILVVIAAACALWLKSRLFGPLVLSDVCIPLIFFTPTQFGQIFVAANLAHGPLPLLLMVLYCLAWTILSVPWRYVLILGINFLLIYTGFGLFIGVITPVIFVADYLLNLRHLPRGKYYFACSVLVSLASFASFFWGYVGDTAVDCKPDAFQSPQTYVRFVSLMFANVIGVKGLGGHEALAGAILIGCMLSALALNLGNLRATAGANSYKYMIAAVLIFYTLLFSAIAAYGRSCLGLAEAQVSRYVMYLELGLTGLYFSVLTIHDRFLRTALLIMFTALLANTIRVRPEDKTTMEFFAGVKRSWKACYLIYSDVDICDKVAGHWILNDQEGTEYTRLKLEGMLDYLKRTKQNLYSDGE
jgi:hypothetical protein